MPKRGPHEVEFIEIQLIMILKFKKLISKVQSLNIEKIAEILFALHM